MRGLEIIGPFRGTSGHDRHTREFTRQLVARGVRVQLTPQDGWSPALPPHARERWFDELCAPADNDVALHFTMPTLCRARAGKVNLNFTMFEADRLPREWIAAAAVHDRVIVPTRSCAGTWIDSGVAAEKMRIVPFGVDGDFFAADAPPLPLVLPNGRPLASYARRFLNIADPRPRKNHGGLLSAWIRGTRRDDDAVLIVKLSPSQPQTLPLFQTDMASLLSRLGRRASDAAPVVFLNATLSDVALRSLYRSATHYISMSCGEGWDFPMMEAAVAGLQLLAPRHSAYPDYLLDDEAIWIPAAHVPAVIGGLAGAEDRRWFDGACWWQPVEEAAADTFRRVMDGGTPMRSPAERLRRDFGWASAAARLHDVLEETA
jgi:glycosyltransferase involved in cell wall biosynthesis